MEEQKKSGFAALVGRPNVGKSTLMNRLIGQKIAITSNKPQTTRNRIQTVYTCEKGQIVFLDTPGILWPKFEDQEVGLKLAFIGSIKDEILQTEELAAELVKFMNSAYPGVLEETYHIPAVEDAYGCLRDIAESRHCLVRGSELDTEKAAAILLDDFRGGRLGRITLERPREDSL